MLNVEELADLPARQYLERFHVEFYLRDVICLFFARRRGDSRSPPEFISQYLEAVLRGEHVLHRGFKYINSTPVNRRGFVLILRQGLRGVGSPETTALTPHDFHDLLVQLCSDFPLAVVLEAARHAKRADARRHHLLGEAVPLASSVPLAEGAAALPAGTGEGAGEGEGEGEGGALLVLRSLQRLAEFCLVYAELLGALKHIFQEEAGHWPARTGSGPSGPKAPAAAAAPAAGGSSRGECAAASGTIVRWPRAQLVSELRFYGGALPRAALPGEAALRRLLRPPGDGGAPSSSSLQPPPVSFHEALTEMAERFELGPAACPDLDLVAGPELPLPDAAAADAAGAAEPTTAPSAQRPTAGAPAERRRRERERERSLRAKGRS